MRWQRAILAVLAGAAVSATLRATMPLAVDNWIQDGVAVVLPEAVPDRAYWAITGALSVVLVTTPGLVVAVLIVATGRKHGPNQCRACGYDLTGNTSGRCPNPGAPGRDAGHYATVLTQYGTRVHPSWGRRHCLPSRPPLMRPSARGTPRGSRARPRRRLHRRPPSLDWDPRVSDPSGPRRGTGTAGTPLSPSSVPGP